MIFLNRYFIFLMFAVLAFNNLKSDDFDDAIDQATSDMDLNNPIKKTKAEITDIDVLKLIKTFNINQILAEDFYCRTNTVLKRPIQSMAIFNLYHTDYAHQCWLFKGSLFYNETLQAYFTDKSPFINSFIALCNPNILNRLEKFEFEGRSIPQIINLFVNAKKSERRTGMLFQALKNFDDLSLEVTLPFVYEERNYFFTPQERENIENLFGRPEKQEEQMFRKHAVSDKLGIGDTRVKLGYFILKNENICTKFGLQCTIPTGFAFKSGLIGSNFARITKKPRPTFNFKETIQLVLNEQITKLKKQTLEFGIQTLDWLNAIVLDSPLGNGGHFGLGAFFEPQIKINHGVTLKALASVEYLFEATERRFFLKKKNPADFTDEAIAKALLSEEAAAQKLQFFNNQIIETLFPPVFKTDVIPGFICQLTVGPEFKLRE